MTSKTKNMFNVLYHQYIGQIREEEIRKYESKHASYLKRAGVSKKSNPLHESSKVNNKSQNNRVRQSLEYESSQLNIHSTTTKFSDCFENQQPRKNRAVEEVPIRTRQVNPESQIDRPFIQKERPIHSKAPQVPSQFEVEKVALIECPEGCGRKFKEQTLQKHVKVCQKIFQDKRKPFKVKVVDQEASKMNKHEPGNDKSQKDKVPKWKKESEQFRKQFGDKSKLSSKDANGQNISYAQEEIDDRIECKGCKRKFNEKAAERHIPICMKKNNKR